ncbi:MAG: hypothetical protein RI947_858 [Candidatus Parcubacteria bacterium]|jgi:hypothetical protein
MHNDAKEVNNLHKRVKELRDILKMHAQKTEDPKCMALCETSSEVMNGIETAFDHYLDKSESIWQ